MESKFKKDDVVKVKPGVLIDRPREPKDKFPFKSLAAFSNGLFVVEVTSPKGLLVSDGLNRRVEGPDDFFLHAESRDLH